MIVWPHARVVDCVVVEEGNFAPIALLLRINVDHHVLRHVDLPLFVARPPRGRRRTRCRRRWGWGRGLARRSPESVPSWLSNLPVGEGGREGVDVVTVLVREENSKPPFELTNSARCGLTMKACLSYTCRIQPFSKNLTPQRVASSRVRTSRKLAMSQLTSSSPVKASGYPGTVRRE